MVLPLGFNGQTSLPSIGSKTPLGACTVLSAKSANGKRTPTSLKIIQARKTNRNQFLLISLIELCLISKPSIYTRQMQVNAYSSTTTNHESS